jgi:hypothetical protein
MAITLFTLGIFEVVSKTVDTSGTSMGVAVHSEVWLVAVGPIRTRGRCAVLVLPDELSGFIESSVV